MTCKLCKKEYSNGTPWKGDTPVCAFDDDTGAFSKVNWNCATMNRLRDIAENVYRDRWEDESIGVLRAPDGWFLVMTWYKERGATSDTLMMKDGLRMRLTEKNATDIITLYDELGETF